MKKAYFISIILCTALVLSCKKTKPTNNTGGDNSPKISQKALLCNTWVLSETYEDDVQKTSNGTGKYKFTEGGLFQYYYNGSWTDVGTYQWNDKDSNSLSVLFNGMSMSYWWYIKKLDEKNYNTEFNVDGKKLNYNYTR